MKLQMLKYFVTLAESCSISEAAQKLYVAQPSLSKSLQLLERELGFSLFSRTKTGIVLTEEGKQILPEAKQVLAYYEGWKQIGRIPSLRRVDIYTHYSFPDFILPNAIFQVRKQHPELAINYSVSMTPETYLSRSVQEPVLAMFLCHGPQGIDKCTQIQGAPPLKLMEGSYCCLVNAQSPLARQPYVNADILRNYYLVLPDNELPEKTPFSTSDIIAATPRDRIIFVESANNVINLVSQDPESYALSYYPALKRYPGVQRGDLIPIPFDHHSAVDILVLSYSHQAFEEYPAVRELVRNVKAQARQFLQKYGSEPLSVAGQKPV